MSDLYTYWLSGRAGQENICLEVRMYRPSLVRSISPDWDIHVHVLKNDLKLWNKEVTERQKSHLIQSWQIYSSNAVTIIVPIFIGKTV